MLKNADIAMRQLPRNTFVNYVSTGQDAVFYLETYLIIAQTLLKHTAYLTMCCHVYMCGCGRVLKKKQKKRTRNGTC